MTEWTLFLRKGVPFHFGYGSSPPGCRAFPRVMLREEAVATFVGIWRNVVEVKVINDYQVVFRMKGPPPPCRMPCRGVVTADGEQGPVDKEGSRGSRNGPPAPVRIICEPPTGPVHRLRAGGEPLGRPPAGVQGIWRSVSPGRIDPPGHAAEWGGPHRGSGARVQGDAEKTRHAQILSASLAAGGCRFYFGGPYHILGTRNSKRRCPGTTGVSGRR